MMVVDMALSIRNVTVSSVQKVLRREDQKTNL
jgi:hypothetical protein